MQYTLEPPDCKPEHPPASQVLFVFLVNDWQAKEAKDEQDAAEDARIAAAVAAADRKAQEAAEKQASKRRAMQADCDKVRGLANDDTPPALFMYSRALTTQLSDLPGIVLKV